ncbi:DUF1801 domain-containing protein [Flindersiella endophytica]
MDENVDAKAVQDYLSALPADRRETIDTVRETVLANLPGGYQERIEHGMLTYSIPLSRYPKTYNKKPLEYVALASQKNYLSLYLMGVYGNPGGEAAFRDRWAKTGKKLDMGKSCVRFKRADDLPLDLVGEVIAEIPVEKYIEMYEAARNR